MPKQRHQSKGFTLVELMIVIAIIVTVLGFMVAGARARLDQAAVNRDIADMETLLGAGKALWPRKVEISEIDNVKRFSSATLPPGNVARRCTPNNNCTGNLNQNQELTPNQWVRFDLSQEATKQWLNDDEQLSGQLPEQFAGANHQNSAYYLFLKEDLVEVSVCIGGDVSVDEAYIRDADECRGNATFREIRLSTSARNARLAF